MRSAAASDARVRKRIRAATTRSVFWARGGIASSATPEDLDYPISQPGAAFGDCTSAAMLAGGVAAALFAAGHDGRCVRRRCVIAVGQHVAHAARHHAGDDRRDRTPAAAGPHWYLESAREPLSNQGRAFRRAVHAARRSATGRRSANSSGVPTCAPILASTLLRRARKTLRPALQSWMPSSASRRWRNGARLLAQQDGQWDVVQHVGELKDDGQVKANGYMQRVDYGDGRSLDMVSVPDAVRWRAAADADPPPILARTATRSWPRSGTTNSKSSI